MATRKMNEILRPRYRDLTRPNRRIPLYDGSVEVSGSGTTAAAPGRLALEWLPAPRLVFELRRFSHLNTVQIKVRGALDPVTGWITGSTLGGAGGLTTGQIGGRLERGRREGLTSVIFHLANFPNYRGHLVSSPHGWKPARVALSAGGWSIDLDCAAAIDGAVDSLEANGGYALTHIGRLTREDGSEFLGAGALDTLEAVGLLLSFAVARESRPFLPVGFDSTDRVAWRCYNQPSVDRWRWFKGQASLYWFDRDDPQGLNRAFRGLYARWADPSQKELLWRAIFYLIDSSRRGVVTGLIVAQAGLELMAWQVLVNETRSLSEDGFGRLDAADKLRLLLTSCGVPVALPAGLVELPVSGAPSPDGPSELTWVRNRWVHPPRRAGSVTPPPGAENAWRLATWYLDLVLLRWCGFSGRYSSRAELTAVVDVPWT